MFVPRDEPTSEKHYALFMSSLSARPRELFLGSMYFEGKNNKIYISRRLDQRRKKRDIRNRLRYTSRNIHELFSWIYTRCSFFTQQRLRLFPCS